MRDHENRRGWLRAWAFLAALGLLLSSCGTDGEGNTTAQPYAVLSAFPAELAAILERARVDEVVMVDGHAFRMGELGGVRVVMGMTGIGLLNAAATTRSLLDHFDVAGVIVSAVAGSTTLQIGDVAVPSTWSNDAHATFAVNSAWYELAAQLGGSGRVTLGSCAALPEHSPDPVCVPNPPRVVLGGSGVSSDPFGTRPFECQPGGDDLFGCDVVTTTASPVVARSRTARATAGPAVVNDMETAAIFAVAAERQLPFIAFRAVSDGLGDPLGLSSSLEQFAVYYRFAAHNAASATVAFLERLRR